MTLSYQTHTGQSLYDVLLNTYGTIKYLVKLMTDNKINGVSDLSFIGKIIYFDGSLIEDNSLYNRNKDENIIYTTYLNVGIRVFGEEDQKTIFISEDGQNFFAPED